jgi:non-specific serine/threonine protein kinase
LVKIAAVAAVVVAGGVAFAAQPAWRPARPIPIPRTEVAAAPLGKEIAVIGGFLRSGANTGRADAYSPARNRWRRLPDLPVTVDHAMAVGVAGRLYVVGGYGPGSVARNTAFAFHHGHWTPLPSMPAPRAAGGAAIVGEKLYVVGGVEAPGRLARDAFAFDFETARWTTFRGPRPREHLGAAALDGQVYVVAGRTGGLDTNQDIVEAFDPRSGRWRAIPRVPGKRGGTAAAAVGGRLLSAGGEEPGGTIRTVYAYSPTTRRWTQLPRMRTSRHGLGLVGWRGRAYALAGGPQPGLTVSGANEVLALGR